MSKPVVTTLYAQLFAHPDRPASERVACEVEMRGTAFMPTKKLSLAATIGGVVEIRFFRTMDDTAPVLTQTTPTGVDATDTVFFAPTAWPSPPAGPTPDEIDRVATALFDCFRDDGCTPETWVEGEFWAYENELRLVVDGDVNLRALAAAAINAVRGLDQK